MIAQSDIPQMTSKFVEIVPAVHHRGNRIFSAADRWPDFSVFLCPEGHLPMLSVTQTHPLLPLFPRRRFPRPTPGRVFAVDHRPGSGFSGTVPSVSQMTSRFAEIIPAYHRRRNRVFSAAPTDGLIFRFSCVRKAICPYFPSSRHTPPVDFTWPSIPSAYAGAGLRCRSSTRLRIFRNSSFGTATSASWNVTYRPWLTTFAPILTTLDRLCRSSP